MVDQINPIRDLEEYFLPLGDYAIFAASDPASSEASKVSLLQMSGAMDAYILDPSEEPYEGAGAVRSEGSEPTNTLAFTEVDDWERVTAGTVLEIEVDPPPSPPIRVMIEKKYSKESLQFIVNEEISPFHGAFFKYILPFFVCLGNSSSINLVHTAEMFYLGGGLHADGTSISVQGDATFDVFSAYLVRPTSGDSITLEAPDSLPGVVVKPATGAPTLATSHIISPDPGGGIPQPTVVNADVCDQGNADVSFVDLLVDSEISAVAPNADVEFITCDPNPTVSILAKKDIEFQGGSLRFKATGYPSNIHHLVADDLEAVNISNYTANNAHTRLLFDPSPWEQTTGIYSPGALINPAIEFGSDGVGAINRARARYVTVANLYVKDVPSRIRPIFDSTDDPGTYRRYEHIIQLRNAPGEDNKYYLVEKGLEGLKPAEGLYRVYVEVSVSLKKFRKEDYFSVLYSHTTPNPGEIITHSPSFWKPQISKTSVVYIEFTSKTIFYVNTIGAQAHEVDPWIRVTLRMFVDPDASLINTRVLEIEKVV